MSGRFRKPLLVAVTILTTLALGGCIVAPYPRYAYGPGYYHPHYWWR